MSPSPHTRTTMILDVEGVVPVFPNKLTELERSTTEATAVTASSRGEESTAVTLDYEDMSSSSSSATTSSLEEGESSSSSSNEQPQTTIPEEQVKVTEKDTLQTPPGTKTQRRSIIRSSSSCEDDLLHVKTKKSCWKSLPPPDLELAKSQLRRLTLNNNNSSSNVVDAECKEEQEDGSSRRPSVSFGSVQIRSYEQTLGDNPSVSYGPPISLDWEFEELEPLPLDAYEGTRGLRRKPRQMMLNYYNRKNLLSWRFGHTEEELKQAEAEMNKIKRRRAITRTLLPAQLVEEALQSAARKSKRYLANRKQQKQCS